MRPPFFIPKLALCGLLIGCEAARSLLIDRDGDGYPHNEDCDDLNPLLHPDVEEICGDGVINGCLSEPEARAFCRLQGERSLAEADVTIVGDSIGEYAGVAVAAISDRDGDGFDELFIGARGNDEGGTDAGAVYILSSSGGPWGAVPQRLLVTANTKIIGALAGDETGRGVSELSDLDGDGLPELLVGAQMNGAGGAKAGAASLLFSGGALSTGAASLSVTTADLTLLGAHGERAAWTVSGVNDIDGDGADELLISAHGKSDAGDSAGGAYLVYSAVARSRRGEVQLAEAAVSILGEREHDLAGYATAPLRDVDGDGRGDVLIGARDQDSNGDQSGAAYLLRSSGALATGGSPLPLADADLKLIGEHAGDGAGRRLSSAGDVDGDGLDDLLIGAPYSSVFAEHAGAAYVVLSSGALAQNTDVLNLSDSDVILRGEAALDEAGWAVGGPGDLDGDALDDVMVSAWSNDRGADSAGAVYVLYADGALARRGESNLAEADLILVGAGERDCASESMTGGNLNGDGLSDLLIGVSAHDAPETAAGATYILLGRGY